MWVRVTVEHMKSSLEFHTWAMKQQLRTGARHPIQQDQLIKLYIIMWGTCLPSLYGISTTMHIIIKLLLVHDLTKWSTTFRTGLFKSSNTSVGMTSWGINLDSSQIVNDSEGNKLPDFSSHKPCYLTLQTNHGLKSPLLSVYRLPTFCFTICPFPWRKYKNNM